VTASRADIDSLPWYHTIELPDGTTTPGQFDVRPALAKAPMPASLAGKRCLDVATCDGFYAIEMARRGAAEVHAIDLDDPAERDWPGKRPEPGTTADYLRSVRSFGIATELTGTASITRHNMSIYDLSPELLGSFDFVVMGSVLLHLRDAVAALQAVRSVTAGTFLSIDTIDLALTLARRSAPTGRMYGAGETRWWTPNAACHRRWVEAAGFEIVDSEWPVWVKFGPAWPQRPPLRELNRAGLRFWFGGTHRFGIPHQWILSQPAF
jgi:tRNA (mo5U34)-methyltransferase